MGMTPQHFHTIPTSKHLYSCVTRVITSPKLSSAFNSHRNGLYIGILNAWRHVRERITSELLWGVTVHGVAGERRVVGVPRFHLWGKCTMPLTKLISTQVGCPTFPLARELYYLYYVGPLFCILGCNIILLTKFCQCHWTLLLYFY